MDISPESCQRRSRFRRQPTGKKLWTSPRDIEIFRLLRRYRYLPSNFIGAFVGGNPIRLKQRLGDLYHEGYLDRPPQQWQTLKARYRHVMVTDTVKVVVAVVACAVPPDPRVAAVSNPITSARHKAPNMATPPNPLRRFFMVQPFKWPSPRGGSTRRPYSSELKSWLTKTLGSRR
jgi:hypothetical protein